MAAAASPSGRRPGGGRAVRRGSQVRPSSSASAPQNAARSSTPGRGRSAPRPPRAAVGGPPGSPRSPRPRGGPRPRSTRERRAPPRRAGGAVSGVRNRWERSATRSRSATRARRCDRRGGSAPRPRRRSPGGRRPRHAARDLPPGQRSARPGQIGGRAASRSEPGGPWPRPRRRAAPPRRAPAPATTSRRLRWQGTQGRALAAPPRRRCRAPPGCTRRCHRRPIPRTRAAARGRTPRSRRSSSSSSPTCVPSGRSTASDRPGPTACARWPGRAARRRGHRENRRQRGLVALGIGDGPVPATSRTSSASGMAKAATSRVVTASVTRNRRRRIDGAAAGGGGGLFTGRVARA